MISLHNLQEIKIVQRVLKNGYFIDAGSSRAVFAISDTKVVKIAIDDEGIQQNKNEVNTFKTFGDSKLARIYAYGKYIVVMERVEYGLDSEDLDCYNREDYNLTEDEVEKIYEVANFLNIKLGETIDNQQVGFSVERQKWVAYDYGLNLNDYHVSDCVSKKLDSYLYMNGVESVLSLVLENLGTKLDFNAKI